MTDTGGWRIPWASKIVAEKAMDSLATLVTMERNAGVGFLKTAPNASRDAGGAKGNVAHDAMEAMLAGQEVTIQTPWVDAGRRFIRDLEPEPEGMEVTLFCDTLMTAGTADFVGRLKRRPDLKRVLLDYKTSPSAYSEHFIQVAAYADTSEYSLDDNGTEHAFEPPDTRLIVLLGADANYSVLVVPKDPRLVRAFRAGLELVRLEDTPVTALPLNDETPWDEVSLQQWLEANPHRTLELAELCREAGVKETRRKYRTREDRKVILRMIKLLEMGESKP
jgi:hypothetical protein